MEIKRGLILVLLAILIVSFVSARQTVITRSDEFRIDLVKYDPSPVEPGKVSDIWFEIRNLGEDDQKNFEITLAEEFPFSLKTGTEKILTFATLKSGETNSFKFPMMINENVPDGDHKLKLQYYSKKAGAVLSEPFSIKVKRVNRDVSATTVKVIATTDMIAPGETAQININIQNSAEYLMKDVTIKLDLNSDSIPFAPWGTTSEKKIKRIPSGQSADVKFNLIALPNAKSDVYKIPLNIGYYDELGDNYTKNDLIGLIIGDVPELRAEVKSNEIYSSRGSGKIILNFVNTGLTDIKSLNVNLEEPIKDFKIFGVKLWTSKGYEILSSNNIYIGDVDVDDDETAEFRLKLKGVNKVTLPLSVEYRDANNREYNQKLDVELKIYNAKDMGVSKGRGWWKTLLILAVLIIFYVFFYTAYKRWKKDNEDEGMMDYISHLTEKFVFRTKRK